MSKKIVMIAGPNGSGKTTTAHSLIANGNMIYEFINADEIARGLAPMHPETVSLAASKLLIKRFLELLEANKNFAFETTASGTNYVKHLANAKEKGYEIHLLFLWLSSPELAIERVTQRVLQGGHKIPSYIIERRYYKGLKNLIKHYLPLSHEATILDNSITDKQSIIARKDIGSGFLIKLPKTWEEIERTANGK